MDDQSSNQAARISASQRVNQRVKSFMQKISFDSYVNSGVSPTDAAVRVGIKLPLGRTFSAQQISKIIERGKLGRRI